MTTLCYKKDKNGGISHSSFENKRKSANWFRKTVSGLISSALEKTELSKFEVESIMRNLLKESDLEVFED